MSKLVNQIRQAPYLKWPEILEPLFYVAIAICLCW
jgi:hypothetical protein